MLIKDIDLLEQVMDRYSTCLGSDLTGYRNHVYRLINLCCLLSPLETSQVEKVVIAGAFHDLGVWTANTFDYLPASRQLAEAFLTERDQKEWGNDVARMIDDHHKISASSANPHHLAEIFRRADWIDVSLGLITFGLDRTSLREIRSTFPNAGFHRRLVALSVKRMLTHPLDPLPMLKR